ncbi:MAG: hypothetical protein OWQ57_08400 [Sulfobacillus sp.]|nr:hypothetical protein [Sulfobacillus sp.]
MPITEPMKRAIIAGILGTLLFSFVMEIIVWLHGPRFDVPLWDGGFVTLNPQVAVLIGYVLEFAIGVGLAYLYLRTLASRHPREALTRGALFGFALWLFLMVIGMPLFTWLSPVVQNGMTLAPGFFLWHYGLMGSITWLLALEAFGTGVSYVTEQANWRVGR